MEFGTFIPRFNPKKKILIIILKDISYWDKTTEILSAWNSTRKQNKNECLVTTELNSKIWIANATVVLTKIKLADRLLKE